jgi:hypothetical protein
MGAEGSKPRPLVRGRRLFLLPAQKNTHPEAGSGFGWLPSLNRSTARTPGCLRWGSHKDPALTVRKRRMVGCADVPGSYSKAMVQTAKGATKNPWLVHMRKCAEEYRKEQEAKAAPKKHLRTKTSPEMSDNESEAKPAPKRRLRAKTSPGDACGGTATAATTHQKDSRSRSYPRENGTTRGR